MYFPIGGGTYVSGLGCFLTKILVVTVASYVRGSDRLFLFIKSCTNTASPNVGLFHFSIRGKATIPIGDLSNVRSPSCLAIDQSNGFICSMDRATIPSTGMYTCSFSGRAKALSLLGRRRASKDTPYCV